MVAYATQCCFDGCDAETINPAAGRWLNSTRWLCAEHVAARRDPETMRLVMPPSN